MKDFIINKESIFEIDSVLAGQDIKKCDLEIENIANNLWKNIGEFEDILQPFFTVFLQNKLLQSLYINYFALRKLSDSYKNISVQATTTTIDIIGRHMNLTLESGRKNYDLEFDLSRVHYFKVDDDPNVFSRNFFKKIARNIKAKAVLNYAIFRGIDVLFMNAGKLEKDFSKIKNSLDANYIYHHNMNRSQSDVDDIIKTVINNIYSMDLSIPNKLIIDLLEEKVFKYLPMVFNQIFSLTKFINKHKVKLVISNATTNETFLCLLAAAKIAEIDSLVIPHGLVTASNQGLDNYCTYQGVLNDFEPKYKGAINIKLKLDWFEI